MNIKDIIFSFSIAILTFWLISYFFFSPQKGPEKSPEELINKSFIAPELAEMGEPLQLHVDFADKPAQEKEQLVTVDTGYGKWVFSNYGATVKQITYLEVLSGKTVAIKSLAEEQDQDISGFFVAFEGIGATPYFYQFKGQQNTSDATILNYQAESNIATVKKQFVVYNKQYKLDLNLTIEPKNGQNNRARLFVPAPIATDVRGVSGLSSIFYNENGSVEKEPLFKIGRLGKIAPTLFGIESHYFANVMAVDSNNFAKRGYFKVEDDNAMAILQSGAISKEMTWHLTFYCGPKEAKFLGAVNDKLPDIISYGWLSPLCKVLLSILNFFYNIFKNYGWAIIALTILINIILLPFRLLSQRNNNMAEFQKKLKYIEQKYSHDPVLLNQHKSEFFKKNVWQAMPGFGNLALFMQLPIFFAISKLLTNAFELYQAPFLWIPNLAESDPYYALPILAGVSIALTLIIQSANAKEVTTYSILGIILIALFANFSAGLLLYIITGSLASTLQTYIQKSVLK